MKVARATVLLAGGNPQPCYVTVYSDVTIMKAGQQYKGIKITAIRFKSKQPPYRLIKLLISYTNLTKVFK